MANLNKVFLIGNLTRNPELRYTPSGVAVIDVDLATSRTYTTRAGDKKEEVCYVRVVAWGKQAETCGEYLTKGSPVFIEGRLQLDSWETNEGEKRSKLKVQAQRIQFLGKTKKSMDDSKRFEDEINVNAEMDENIDDVGELSDDIPF